MDYHPLVQEEIERLQEEQELYRDGSIEWQMYQIMVDAIKAAKGLQKRE